MKTPKKQNVITESAKTVDELPKNVGIEITKGFLGDSFTIQFISLDDKELDFNGMVDVVKPTDKGDCLGAYMISFSRAPKGFGPLLYDIALEYAGKNGIVPDRANVSDQALKIWNYYYNNRSDIEKKSLENTDCSTESSKNLSIEQAKVLNSVYYKSGTPTIDKLKKTKKLVLDGVVVESTVAKQLWESVKEEVDLLGKTIYHGTNRDFSSGDYIKPPEETGEISEKGRKKNLNKVFFTLDKGSAKIYAGRAVQSFGFGDPSVYEVEPVGEIEWSNKTPGTTVLMAPMARVIRKI
jgi:hypothetical protein